MVDRRQDLVIVTTERSDLSEVLTDILASAGRPTEIAELDETTAATLAKELKNLAAHPFNQADGQVRVLFKGGHHFPLRKTLYSALVLTVTLTGSVMVAVVEPMSGAVGIVGTVLGAIERANELISKLTPEEVVVYEALLEIMKQRRDAGERQPRVTAEDVKMLFKKRQEAAPDPANTLQVLRDKDVVKFELSKGQTQYWIEP